MFTGLIDATAQVLSIEINNQTAFLKLNLPYSSLMVGESIAVNGVCLTLLNAEGACAEFNLSSETLALTHLADLQMGQWVSCERALTTHSRLGGHMVSGHVDKVARVIQLERLGDYVKLVIGPFSENERLFLIKKGSICVDGVSLTINEVLEDGIELMLVPHTIQQTHFAQLTLGQMVNIEFDCMTRTIAHQLKIMLTDEQFKKYLT